MRKIIQKISDNAFIFLGIATLYPFLLISWYNTPSADDIFIVSVALKKDFWALQNHYYQLHTGRFTSTFLLGLYASLSKELVGYWIWTTLLYGLFAHALYRFLKHLFINELSNQQLYSLLLGLFVIYFYKMPSLVQGVYWLTGYLTYLLPIILTLHFFVDFMKNGRRKRTATHWLAGALAAIFITAGNEIALLIWGIFLAVYGLWQLYQHRKLDNYLVFIGIISLIAALITIFAPGNVARAERWENKHLLWFSFSEATITALWYIKIWLLQTPVVLFLLAYLPFGGKFAQNNPKHPLFSLHPLFVLSILGISYWITFFPPYWAIGGPPPLRVINVSYLIFLLGGIFGIQSIIHYLYAHHQFHIKPYSLAVKGVLGLGILLFFLLPNNINQAFNDLFSGEAKAFYQEVKNRETEVLNCPPDTCELNRYQHRPPTIYFDDITYNTEDWRNKCYATFYGKKAVRWK